MWITLLAILTTLGLAYYPHLIPIEVTAPELAALMIIGGTVILLLSAYINTSILQPLNKLELKLIPNLVDTYRHDIPLRFIKIGLFAFAFLSFLMGTALLSLDVSHRLWIMWAWIILFAMALDLLLHNWNLLMSYLNPKEQITNFKEDAISSVQSGSAKNLWNSIDTIAEVALKAVENSKIALGTQALQTFPPIMHAFFDSSKSISRMGLEEEVEKNGQDETSYTIFYLLQRLELINDKALANRLETICRQMVITLGKIITYAARLDMSLVSFPTHFLVKFGLKAQQHYFDEVTALTTSTLLEIARTIVNDVDITYAELVDPFKSIINGLDAISKGIFKKDKYVNIKVLTQPLLDLRDLLNNPKIASHRDEPAIRQDVDRVINEFEMVDQVMRSIPPLPQDLRDQTE